MSSLINQSTPQFIELTSRCKYPSGLYLVGTPIGNLEDITLRALSTLKRADIILCEDTRVTQKLLQHYGISKPLEIYNDTKGESERAKIISHLAAEKRVVLVSDAGMPLISDPGYKLVQAVIDAGYYLTCIPGPSAALTGLVLSGAATNSFQFKGFFPRKEKESCALFDKITDAQTLIFYESAPRISKTLKFLKTRDEVSNVAIARELTKQFEEVLRGTASDLLERVLASPLKGEIVLIVQTNERQLSPEDVECVLKKFLDEGCSTKEAAKAVSDKTGKPRKELYSLALKLKENDS